MSISRINAYKWSPSRAENCRRKASTSKARIAQIQTFGYFPASFLAFVIAEGLISISCSNHIWKTSTYQQWSHFQRHFHLQHGAWRYCFTRSSKSESIQGKNFSVLTGPFLRKYLPILHELYPQNRGISASHWSEGILGFASIISERWVNAIWKARTLYKEPSAPTPHPSSRYPILVTIAAIPHALRRAARLPTRRARARKNCRSASVVSMPKKWVKMPIIIRSSSVGSLPIRKSRFSGM